MSNFNMFQTMKQAIMIITDDIIFPNLFHILLQRMMPDLKIDICESCEEIDNSIDSENYKLIILDGKLSKTSPIQIVQHIRVMNSAKMPIWFFIPEILMKSYIDKLYEMGASRMITKPFDPYIITSEIVLV